MEIQNSFNAQKPMLKKIVDRIIDPAFARLKGEVPLDKATSDRFRQFLVAACSEQEGEGDNNSAPKKTPRED